MDTMNYVEIAKWSQIITAIIFYALMLWLWFKFGGPALKAAQESHNRQLAEAERHRDEAKAALDSLRHEIEGAHHDAAMIRSRGEEAARREASAIVAEARETGERSLRNAQGELERARAAARDAFREELAQKALDVAHREAAGRVDGAVNAQLVDRFLSSLERGARN